MKKMSKKSTQKKVSLKKNLPANLNPEETVSQPSVAVKKSPSFYIGLGIVTVLALTLLYTFKSLFVVALVNNQPITRLAVIADLEQQAGKQVLTSLVTKVLIEQEAVKRKIVVDNKTLDAEMKKVENKVKAQGQNLDQLLAMQNMSRAVFRDQLKTQKIIELMFTKETKVSKKEVQDYLEKNAEALAENANIKESDIRSQLEQEKLRSAFQAWLEKAKKEAKITYFLSY
jgi:foldase protein PrsA